MGRSPCCSKIGLNRGSWTASEDRILSDYINLHGEGRWRQLPIKAGLKRCGKSCRLRWLNYLKPDIKRGNISSDEEDLIIRLHKLLGNRWSLIAGRLPGRTDNEIKNYWNTTLAKKLHNAIGSCDEHDLKKKRKLEDVDKECEGHVNDQTHHQVVRTKAARCSRTHFNFIPQDQPIGIKQHHPLDAAFPLNYHHQDIENNCNPSTPHFNQLINIGEGSTSSGMFNHHDFTQDLFNNHDHDLVNQDMLISGGGSSTINHVLSKEILDYFTSIPEIGGEWLSSL